MPTPKNDSEERFWEIDLFRGIAKRYSTAECGKKYRTIRLKLGVPTGKLSDIVRVIPVIKSKFTTVDVKVEISAENGEMAESDYEDKIKEAIKQAEVEIEDEGVE